MSLVLDQIRRIDTQLDKIHFNQYESTVYTSSSGDLDADSSVTVSNGESEDIPLNTDRIAELQAAIKLLSPSSTRSAPLSPEGIVSALRYAKLLDAPPASRVKWSDYSIQRDLEWLIVGKATAQAHGLIINLLLEQTLPLGWDIWYWDEVLNSSFFLGLFSLQTSPSRLWHWSKSILQDAHRRLQRDGESEIADQPQAAPLSQTWSKFYSLVKDSIREHSTADIRFKIFSPLMLCRSEARAKQQRLKRFREMSACGLGVLVDEGMNLDVDEDGISRTKSHKDEWKTVISKSVSLMETILRNLTVLDLGIHDFEETVFTGVEEDPELSHVNTEDDDPEERLALVVLRLQLILQEHLPNHQASVKSIVRACGRPSRIVRYWLPATALMLSSGTLLRIMIRRKAQIMTWISDLGATTIDFWYNWVVEPLRKVVGTIRHDKDSEITIMSKESLEGDRASLERMVVDFAVDNPPSASRLPFDDAAIATIRAKVREGDLTAVLQAYEKDLRRPFMGTIRGELIRALLIQIQKTKVDVEVAVGGIDALLKSQELVFGFIGLTPGLLVSWALFRWFGGVFSGRRGRRAQEGRGQRIRLLRNIDRILSASTHSNNGTLSYKDHGMLLCEVHLLRQSSQRVMPADIYAEFLEEIDDLVDLRTGIERQIRVVDRLRWAYLNG
ncbi:MAG: hypothetical protein Q9220_000960 [cf. Caloplaca sp. 1 TL-2023]